MSQKEIDIQLLDLLASKEATASARASRFWRSKGGISSRPRTGGRRSTSKYGKGTVASGGRGQVFPKSGLASRGAFAAAAAAGKASPVAVAAAPTAPAATPVAPSVSGAKRGGGISKRLKATIGGLLTLGGGYGALNIFGKDNSADTPTPAVRNITPDKPSMGKILGVTGAIGIPALMLAALVSRYRDDTSPLTDKVVPRQKDLAAIAASKTSRRRFPEAFGPVTNEMAYAEGYNELSDEERDNLLKSARAVIKG